MTLIEIIVVIAMIAILMGLVAIAVIPQMEGSKKRVAEIDIGTLMNALDMYYVQRGNYPDVAAGFPALVDAGVLKKIPKDPWGSDYLYFLEQGKPVVVSYGADKAQGGEGDNADISSKDSK
ncbi:MAG: type II secretion system protein GspG [Cystobacterineae bacterium]|nr:type II secretion system protein GspG [Cystobacterineae bacterium]